MATIHEIFRIVWAKDRLSQAGSTSSLSDLPPRINDQALGLSAEYLRLFTLELIHRSVRAAIEESETQKSCKIDQEDGDIDDQLKSAEGDGFAGRLVEVKNLQKIAPGVLLDF
ncbi:hypothetical protein BY996DRAFT_2551311 [Phakopsora pachyrhizi]|nr:hypothetical protein BY996DRAFT_2551311 [Phakopsora pachyrhizi]